MRKLSPGAKAWGGLVVYVAVADAYLIVKRQRTMSSVFGEALQHPAKRWPVLAVWGFLSMHLHKAILPEFVGKADPLHAAFVASEKVWYSVSGEHHPIKSD